MTLIHRVIRLFKRNPWLVAVLMMALSSLACDDTYPTLPFVEAVQADAQVPGRAFARVRDVPAGVGGNATRTKRVYETNDYGRTWTPSLVELPDAPAALFTLNMSREILRDAAGRELWRFPRETFRSFFHHDSYGYRYQLPAMGVNNSAGEGVLYVAMGTEGVLVGRFGAEEVLKLGAWSRVTWSLESRGLDPLKPLKLTITNPLQVAGVVVLGIVIPPLVLIHAYVLRRVWRYATSERNAGYWATLTSLCLVVFAGLAIVIWLIDVNTDYYPMVAVMTAITVAMSVGASALLTRGRSPELRTRLIGVTALVALIVPAGVAAIWALWPAIIAIACGYWIYQRVYAAHYGKYLSAVGYPRPRWLVDRLALETVAAGVIATIVAVPVTSMSSGLLPLRNDYQVLLWLAILASAWIAAIVVTVYRQTASVVRWVVRDVGEQAAGIAPLPTIGLNDHVKPVLSWILVTAVFAGVVFIAQSWAYGWFGALLR